MEEDDHLQIGFYRAANAKLLRYWVDYGCGEEFNAALAMLREYGRHIPEDETRADSYVFDNPNHELFFKIRFSESFMEEENFPWDYYYESYDYDDDYYTHNEWEWQDEPVHDRFFVPAKVKVYYGIGFD
jgi:hypothetical protein